MEFWKNIGALLLWGSFFFMMAGMAQTPDVFRAEYMLMPNNAADARLSRIKLVANVPLKVRDSNNIVIGAEYNNIGYTLDRADVSLGEKNPVRFHVLDLNLAYIHKYGRDWRLIGVLTPRLASTLTHPLENGDFSINATVGAFRDRPHIDKPTRLVLGIAYNSTVALRIPLPVVYFEKRFHPNWSYVLGAPKTGLKFHFKERHTVQTEFILDGYYVHLQNGVVIPDAGYASSVSSSAALATMGYSYNFTKVISVYGFVGHTLFQSAVLRDTDRNDIFTLNDEPGFYFRTGFRIGL